jgi:hypothetical protein
MVHKLANNVAFELVPGGRSYPSGRRDICAGKAIQVIPGSRRSPLILASSLARARALEGYLVTSRGNTGNNTLWCSYRTAMEMEGDGSGNRVRLSLSVSYTTGSSP